MPCHPKRCISCGGARDLQTETTRQQTVAVRKKLHGNKTFEEYWRFAFLIFLSVILILLLVIARASEG